MKIYSFCVILVIVFTEGLMLFKCIEIGGIEINRGDICCKIFKDCCVEEGNIFCFSG